MSSLMDGASTHRPGGTGLSRRRVLSGASIAGFVSLTGIPAASASGALTARQGAMALAVVRVVAQFPVEFPELGERPPALSRATPSRLAKVVDRLTPRRLSEVREALDELIATGLPNRQPRKLLMALGARLGQGPVPAAPLVALVAVATATLNRDADPNEDGCADVWTGLMARMHAQRTLADAVTRRSLR